MDESKNQGFSKEMLGCVGAIGAALVTGIFALIIALPTLAPFFAQSTATPIVVVITATSQSNMTVSTPPVSSVQPTILPTQSTLAPTNNIQCSHFQIGSTPTVVPIAMWVVTRTCSPARSACFYAIEQSLGGEYSSYEHNGTADRRWVNAFCTEAEAKNFANTDAKAMLGSWQYTEQNPFP